MFSKTVGRCPPNVAPDASGNSKANRSFPAECPCRVLLALFPPAASAIPKSADCRNIRRAGSPVLRTLPVAGAIPAQFPDFCACSTQRPAFAAAAPSRNGTNLRAPLPLSRPAAPPNTSIRPATALFRSLTLSQFACDFSLFPKPPSASYCLSGFFSIYSLAGKIITFNLFVRLT